jgi:calcineurin-like phosphoesterase family protein
MKIFLISDNHFDALDYMHHVFPRPEFKDNDDMNKQMIQRWNSVVSDDDLVISIGDFCYTDPRPWLDKLNGNKIMIRGSHDDWCEGYAGDYHMILEYYGIRFLIIHDPEDWKHYPKNCRNWTDWVIHGHHHWRKEFPHINGRMKRINVACELVDYTPVAIDDIVTMKNLESVEMMTRNPVT